MSESPSGLVIKFRKCLSNDMSSDIEVPSITSLVEDDIVTFRSGLGLVTWIDEVDWRDVKDRTMMDGSCSTLGNNPNY